MENSSGLHHPRTMSQEMNHATRCNDRALRKGSQSTTGTAARRQQRCARKIHRIGTTEEKEATVTPAARQRTTRRMAMTTPAEKGANQPQEKQHGASCDAGQRGQKMHRAIGIEQKKPSGEKPAPGARGDSAGFLFALIVASVANKIYLALGLRF